MVYDANHYMSRHAMREVAKAARNETVGQCWPMFYENDESDCLSSVDVQFWSWLSDSINKQLDDILLFGSSSLLDGLQFNLNLFISLLISGLIQARVLSLVLLKLILFLLLIGGNLSSGICLSSFKTSGTVCSGLCNLRVSSLLGVK